MIKRAQSAQPLNLNFSYEDMFKVATRQTSAFGIDGYEPPQKYVDPIKQVKEREYSTQKKGLTNKISLGQKNKNYVTRRGHYLEDLKKQTDGIPAANKYDVTIRWKSAKPDTKRPQTAAPKRTTFIDDIFKEAKLRKVPGSGAYNIQKPLEEVLKQVEELKKKKISESDRPERPTYLNDIMHLAVINPGPGNYNPRPVSTKLKINETEPKDMIAKHKGKDKLVKSKLPDMGTYKPEALEFTTFNKIQSQKKLMVDKSKFGTLPKDPRFKDPKLSKSKQKQAPGPGQYALIVNWQGKEEGLKKQTKKSYMDTTTKGVQRSIYY